MPEKSSSVKKKYTNHKNVGFQKKQQKEAEANRRMMIAMRNYKKVLQMEGLDASEVDERLNGKSSKKEPKTKQNGQSKAPWKEAFPSASEATVGPQGDGKKKRKNERRNHKNGQPIMANKVKNFLDKLKREKEEE